MAQQRVYLYKAEVLELIPIYKVYPAVIVLKKNDDLVLVNTTDEDAEWIVPAGVLDDGSIDEPVNKHTYKTKTAKKEGPRASTYTVKVGLHRAIGHSDPVIIIDG
jgi:hypothetical protein